MSRIAKSPVTIPAGVDVKLSDNFIQGPSLQILCDFFENFYNSSVMVKFCGKS